MLGFLLVGFNRKLVKWKRHQRLETHRETTGDSKEGTIALFRGREGNVGCWGFKIMSKENNYFI